MRDHRLAHVRGLWEAGRYLEAGRVVYEDLPRERRPVWAASMLAAVCRYAPSTPEIDAVLEVARTPVRWHEGHDVFDAVRRRTLQMHGRDRVYEAVLMLAENTAKVIYNATLPSAPFDADSGWWLVPNLMAVCALAQDPALTERAWTLIRGDDPPTVQ